MKILCIGHATYDFYLPMSSFPLEDKKYRCDDSIECGGGPAATAAYVLGKWGCEVYYHGVLGTDLFAKKILKGLKAVNVKTKFVEITEEGATTISFIIVNKKNGSRTMLNYGEKTIDIRNFNYDITPDIILSDGYNYEASIRAITNNPNAISILDAEKFNDSTLDIAKRVNYVICSKTFAELASKLRINYDDEKSLMKMYDNLESLFKGRVVVTLEEKGCMYKDDQGKIKIMTGLKVKPKDTTSAGDIFHGAFVYGISKGLSLETSLKIANIAAGLSVTEIGGWHAVPTLERVHEIYEKNN